MSDIKDLQTSWETIKECGCRDLNDGPVIYKDEEGWKLFMNGVEQHWKLGITVPEAKFNIRTYASEGFGTA